MCVQAECGLRALKCPGLAYTYVIIQHFTPTNPTDYLNQQKLEAIEHKKSTRFPPMMMEPPPIDLATPLNAHFHPLTLTPPIHNHFFHDH